MTSWADGNNSAPFRQTTVGFDLCFTWEPHAIKGPKYNMYVMHGVTKESI